MFCLAKFLGKFATIFHDVTGEAYAVADNKILIKVFFLYTSQPFLTYSSLLC